MRRCLISQCRKSKANGLRSPEKDHADTAGQEESATSDTLNEETCCYRDKKVPNLQNTIDEKLRCRARDANCVEDFVEVVGYKTIARPLREESDSNNDPNPLAITRSHDERLPADICCDRAVKFEGCFDLLKLVYHKRILS